MVPEPALVARFQRDLDALSAAGQRIGIAVSGGADSLALLILAAAARPGLVEAASVDHALRPESRAEGEMVAALCRSLGVAHAILTVAWAEEPVAAVQEKARTARYDLLADWLAERAVMELELRERLARAKFEVLGYEVAFLHQRRFLLGAGAYRA